MDTEGTCLLLAGQTTQVRHGVLLWLPTLALGGWTVAPRCPKGPHLQLVFMFLVDPGQQLSLPSVEGINEGVTLGHQTGLKLHTVFLNKKAPFSSTCLGSLGSHRNQSTSVLFTEEMGRNSVHRAH